MFHTNFTPEEIFVNKNGCQYYHFSFTMLDYFRNQKYFLMCDNVGL